MTIDEIIVIRDAALARGAATCMVWHAPKHGTLGTLGTPRVQR